MTAASQLALSGAEFAGLGDLDNVRVGTDGLQQSDGSAGLLKSAKGRVGHNERELGDRGDAVTAGLDERND